MSNVTTCSKCGRAVLKSHVSSSGKCIICDPAAAAAPAKPESTSTK